MPEFTIFTCTYQNAAFVKRCYYSILRQYLIDWEWLIIDDGSTDSTEMVVRSLNDPRIVYKRLDTNQGRGRARNYGLPFIKGKWVVILDMDDFMLSNRLDYVKKAMDSGFDFMISEVALVSNDMICRAIRPSTYKRGITVFTHATLCCRADLYKEVGYFNSKYSEDQKIIVSFGSTANGYVVDEPLYLYQESANQNLKGASKANITAFKLILNFIRENKKYRTTRMFYYAFGFLQRYFFLILSQIFIRRYDFFVKNRIRSEGDQKKVEKVNLFIETFKREYAL